MLLRGKIRGPGFKPIFSISVPENCLSALFVGRRVLYLNCLQSSMTQSRAISKHPASIEQQTSQTKTFFALAVESASVSQSGKITCSPPNGMGAILHGVLENSGEACPVRSTQESKTWSYEDGNAERNLIQFCNEWLGIKNKSAVGWGDKALCQNLKMKKFVALNWT